MKKLFSSLALAACFGSLLTSIQPVFAQGTAFTYQGQLQNNGSPANGNYDFTFALFNNNSTNTGQVGSTLTNTNVGVTNGLFTVTLDFGPVFMGNATWLAIGARPNGAAGFTALNPLQELTPAPYAIYSPNAGTAANVTGPISLSQLPAAVLTNNDTNSVNLTGSFSGNGSQLTNLSPAALAANGATVLAQTNVYATNGVYSFTIPSGIGQITVKLWGAGGQGGSDTEGGGGAFSGVTQTVTPGQEFVAVVGQNGGAGGGASSGDAGGGGVADTYGGNGGQASSLFQYTGTDYIMQAVAGGGGGGGLVFGANAGQANGTGSGYAANATTTGVANLDLIGGQGQAGATENGGCGGGYGGGASNADGQANGGGSYGTTTISGFFQNPANISDPNYVPGAAAGGAVSHWSGGDGLVVVIFSIPSLSFSAQLQAPYFIGNFVGNGAGLTNLPSVVVTNNETGVTLSGTFYGNGAGLTNLPGVVVTNNETGVTLSGTFYGNGAGLTNLPGVVVTNNETGVTLSGTFYGNGAGLTNLPGVVVTNNETGVTLSGTFYGNGGGLTNLNAASLTGALNVTNITATNMTAGILTVGTNITSEIAPLTVPANIPSSAIGSVATGSNSQCVVVAGRYAYVGNYSSSNLQVIDVSVPSSPVVVGSLKVAGNPSSVAVAGRYAYLEYQNSTTMDVIDISGPTSPALVGSIATGNYPASIVVAGRYAYEVNNGASTLYVIDVSNPTSPIVVGMVGTDTSPNCVVVAGRYAYVGNGSSGFFDVIDVSDPVSPVLVGYTSAGPNIVSVTVSGRYAYAANGGNLYVIDVSDPTAPAVVGGAGIGNNSSSVAVAGRYAYVTDSILNKLQVIDVSNPTRPVVVGTVPTGGSSYSVAVAGRYVYVANRNGAGTLQVFDFGGEYVQQLEAGTMETGTLQTRDTVTVGNNLDVRGGMTVSASARINGGLGVNGSVGIGISAPAYTLQVNGSVAGVGAYNNVSDARYKTNITRLTHALDKIMALQGVEYDWRSNAFPQMKFDNGKQLGFVAQEIKDVLPEVVSQDAQGYYSIAYSKVIPVLVEAIKDQQNEMKAKADKVDSLEKQLGELKQMVQSLAERK